MTIEAAIQEMLECVCSALAVTGWEGECCLIPGNPVVADCCENGGRAWARLVRMYPSAQFPAEDGRTAVTDCSTSTQWAVVAEIGASVCVSMEEEGCAKDAADASKVLAYTEAAVKGLTCCFSDVGRCRDAELRINAVRPGGPLGGCGGFTMEVVRSYDMSCCPPSEESS